MLGELKEKEVIKAVQLPSSQIYKQVPKVCLHIFLNRKILLPTSFSAPRETGRCLEKHGLRDLTLHSGTQGKRECYSRA